MNPYNVLVKPLLSEKSNHAREDNNKYSFIVRPEATKLDVKKSVEALFDVKVANVKTLITRGKMKRRGNNYTKLSNTKKAVVTLVEGNRIKLFEDL